MKTWSELPGADKLSEHDRAEMEKFERLLHLVHDGKSQKDAHAEVYGEVVFDAAPGAVTPAKGTP